MSSGDHTWKPEYKTRTPHPPHYDCDDLGKKVVQLQKDVRFLRTNLILLFGAVVTLSCLVFYTTWR